MIKKYVRTAIFLLISFLILVLVLNTLYYFDIISLKTSNIIRFIFSILILFFSGKGLGKKVSKNGYLEGIKLGLFIVLLFFSLSLLFKVDFSINLAIYYIILFMSAMVGSMRGINTKKIK